MNLIGLKPLEHSTWKTIIIRATYGFSEVSPSVKSKGTYFFDFPLKHLNIDRGFSWIAIYENLQTAQAVESRLCCLLLNAHFMDFSKRECTLVRILLITLLHLIPPNNRRTVQYTELTALLYCIRAPPF